MLHLTTCRTRLESVVAPLLLLAAGAAPLLAQGQSRARLQGVVVDERTYQPVEDATVALVGRSFVASTDGWGAFAFPASPFGSVSIRVSAPGYPSVVQEVEVRRNRIAFVQVVLPTLSATLQGLLVEADSRAANDAVAQTAADLLANQIPRARVHVNGVGRDDYQLVLRPGTTLSGEVAPMVVIDGVAVSTTAAAYEALRTIPANDVAEIEVLKGPAAAARYPLAANGVIIVKTKRGG